MRVPMKVGVWALALTTLAGSPLAAQGGWLIIGRGGVLSPRTNLNVTGSQDFKSGTSFGGGIGYQFVDNVSLRLDVDYSTTEWRILEDSEGDFNKLFVGATWQFQKNGASGITPFLTAGGGAVRVTDKEVSESKWFGSAHIGVGLGYRVQNSGFMVFAEGVGHLYKMADLGQIHLTAPQQQFDVGLQGGIKYNFSK